MQMLTCKVIDWKEERGLWVDVVIVHQETEKHALRPLRSSKNKYGWVQVPSSSHMEDVESNTFPLP